MKRKDLFEFTRHEGKHWELSLFGSFIYVVRNKLSYFSMAIWIWKLLITIEWNAQ